MIPSGLDDWAPWSPRGHRIRTFEGAGGALDLMLYEPEGAAPEGGWPCLVVLDGDRFFGAAAGAVAALSRRPEKTGVAPMAVAAIARRAGGGAMEDARARDFTRHPSAGPGAAPPGGHAAAFLQRLVEEVLPGLVAASPIDPRRLTLFGHSLAGLFVLETLEAAPDLFARWVSISPSLWWRTPDPAIGGPGLMIGCGEAETRRNMRAEIEHWATTKSGQRACFRLAPGADHGSAPFALLPDALRHASAA